MIIKFGLIMIIVISILLTSTKISYNNIWILNILCCIILSIFAYHLVPLKSLDIYRYYNQIEFAKQNGIEYILKHNDYRALPIAGIYISLFVILNNKYLLPAVTCFIYYFFISNIIIKYSKDNKKSKYGLMSSLIAFYLISNYLGVVSAIRNPMAISLFCYFLYKDLVMNIGFKKSVFGYILLCLFHPSIIGLLIIRLLLLLNKKHDKIICIFLLLWTSMKTILISILLKIRNNNYILLISQKLLSYDSTEANAVANVSVYTIVYLLFYISCIIIFLVYKAKCSKNDNYKYFKFDRFLVFLFCFCIGSIFEYHMFVRFSRSILMIVSLPIINIMSCDKINSKNKILVLFLVLIESLLFLVFYMTGQYTSISFF